MKKLLIILFFISSVAHGQIVFGVNTNPAVVSAPKVAKIDFRASGTSTGLTNWNTMAGNPGSSVLTISNLIDTTGSNTGWSITTKSTSNWINYSGCTCSSNNSVNGITGGSAMPGGSTQSYQSIIFNYGTITPARYDATKWQFEIGGLDNSKTYKILICGSEGTLGFDNQYYSVRITGATTDGPYEVDGGPGSGGGYTTVGTISSKEMSVQPSGGIIKVWLNTQSGGTSSSDLAVICSMRITQN